MGPVVALVKAVGRTVAVLWPWIASKVSCSVAFPLQRAGVNSTSLSLLASFAPCGFRRFWTFDRQILPTAPGNSFQTRAARALERHSTALDGPSTRQNFPLFATGRIWHGTRQTPGLRGFARFGTNGTKIALIAVEFAIAMLAISSFSISHWSHKCVTVRFILLGRS